MLVHHSLDFYAQNYPDNNCITFGARDYTYRSIQQMSNRLANGLLELGVKKGERIAILGQNSVEHLLLLIAAGRIGAVTVPLNYRLAPPELAYIISDAKVNVLMMTDLSYVEVLSALQESLGRDLKIIENNKDSGLDWTAWLDKQSDSALSVDVAESDAFLQLYTSGTTGNPKGVVLSHKNLVNLCVGNTMLTMQRVNPGMADIICAPMFHIGGSGSVLISIFGGAHILLHQAFDPARFVEDMESYSVNSVFMVPAMISAVLQLPDIEKRDFSRLRQVYYGSAPISEALLRQALNIFQADFMQFYGLTETTGTIVTLSPADHLHALESQPELLKSCGRPTMGSQIKIMDKNGCEAPNGEVGEIWIQSDSNMLSYYNMPEATEKTLTDGWIHSGDAGYVDENGFLFLKDRIKDMVVSGAENIYPVEVENTIANHEAIVEVAVIGIPDEKFGEALLAFVVLKPGMTLTTEELIEFCRPRIAGYKIPRKMEIVDALPRNAVGKLAKSKLRKPYWEGRDRAIS